MGTVTITYDSPGRPASFGNKRVVFGTITLSASYATGGDTLPDRKFGLAKLDFVVPLTPAGGSVLVKFDSETTPTKVLAYWFNYPAAAAGAAVEVTAATNLSAYSFRFMAVGA